MFWGCGQCTSSPGFCFSGHSENIAVTIKAAACQMFIPRKWTKSHGETRSRERGSFSANKLEALCWVPWLYAQSRKSPCCFLVFNLKKKPVCENMSPLDVSRNLVTGSPWGQIFELFFFLGDFETEKATSSPNVLYKRACRSSALWAHIPLSKLYFPYLWLSDAQGHLELVTTRRTTWGRTFVVWALWSLELYCLVSHGLCGNEEDERTNKTLYCAVKM